METPENKAYNEALLQTEVNEAELLKAKAKFWNSAAAALASLEPLVAFAIANAKAKGR